MCLSFPNCMLALFRMVSLELAPHLYQSGTSVPGRTYIGPIGKVASCTAARKFLHRYFGWYVRTTTPEGRASVLTNFRCTISLIFLKSSLPFPKMNGWTNN